MTQNLFEIFKKLNKRDWILGISSMLITACLGAYTNNQTLFQKYFKSYFVTTDNKTAWIMVSTTIGGCIGGLYTGPIINKFGSKKSVKLFGAAFLGTSILVSSSFLIKNLYLTCLGGILFGFIRAIILTGVIQNINKYAGKDVKGIVVVLQNTGYSFAIFCFTPLISWLLNSFSLFYSTMVLFLLAHSID